jgi:hypothetical protein
LNKKKKNTHPIVKRIVRLKIALLILFALSIFGAVYYYSSESKQPFIGNPKELNQALLNQEIENARILFLVDSLKAANAKLTKESELVDGIFFEVMITSFESFKLDKDDANLKRLNYTTHDGVNYMTLGKFRDLEDAKFYIDDLKKIGINDAFVVSKLDGKRVSIHE